MSRPRSRGNKNLPQNLYCSKKAGVAYYRYRHPLTGKETGFGTSRQNAIDAARRLNDMLMPTPHQAQRVLAKRITVSDWLDRYIDLRMKEQKKPSQKTLSNWLSNCRGINKAIGDIELHELSVADVSRLLNHYIDEGMLTSGRNIRSFLVKALRYAVAQGLATKNAAADTLPITTETQRQRLSIDCFNAILDAAPADLSRAMRLALVTLQRRSDLIKIRWADVRDGYLYVIQQKTEKHGDAARLRIALDDHLSGLINECRDGVFSPWVLHRVKASSRSKVRPGDKWSADALSKAFAAVRDRTGLFNDIPPRQRPSFHEIRALGAHLYEKSGVDPQALLGHTKGETTAVYLGRHEEKWTEVSASLVV